jgi:ribonuclease HII
MLDERPCWALVDGNRAPELPCPVRTVVGGDRLSVSIAAASIVAKVTRDRIMDGLAADFPLYGWERNRGYGTAEHLAALARHGATPHHRRSFRPVAGALTRR